MGNNDFMSQASLKIRFEGQEHQIDANTLISTLKHYELLVALINDEIGEGEKKINLKINSFDRGSFIIDIDVVTTWMETLFSKENIQYTANVVNIFGVLFTLYIYQKGSPIKNETVINNYYSGEIDKKTIINIYNNSYARDAISKSFEAIHNDDTIESLVITPNRTENPIIVERAIFESLIYEDFDKEVESDNIMHVTEETILSVIVVSFDPKTKWKFLYNGMRIPAMSMKDANLQEQIDKGLRFAKGDSIRVKLEITKEYNPALNAYENKKYRILEVLEHIKSPYQSNLML